MTERLRYPIGRYEHPGPVRPSELAGWLEEIEALPGRVRAAVEPLTDEQLGVRYRPGGWTLRQVVHHLPESHLNCYIRFKWALTEERPTIKTYHEDRWASFKIHDYEDSYTLQAFVERGTGLEWKLNNAFKTEPRKFGRRRRAHRCGRFSRFGAHRVARRFGCRAGLGPAAGCAGLGAIRRRRCPDRRKPV